MIYRIIGESEAWYWDGDSQDWVCGSGRLLGAGFANLGDFGDLPAPALTNPRARFWFTESGWREYGRYLLADAYRTGRVFRLLQQKNPPDSAVVYRDKWQVALLPVKGKAR